MSYRGGYDHSQRGWKRTGRNRSDQNESNRNNAGDNQRGGYYNNRSGHRSGRGNNYNQRPYNISNRYVPNNNRPSSYNMNQEDTNDVSNLQINSSRFARQQNTTTSTGAYKSRRPYRYQQQQRKDPPNFDKFAFPNDWHHFNTADVRPWENYMGWKASKPKIKYYTSDGLIYPDRVGVPQICSKGNINDIIDTGCKFLSEHFQIHPALLPGALSLMIFRKENSNYNFRKVKHNVVDDTQNLESGSQIRLKYSWSTFFQILWINAKQNKHFGIEIPELGWKLAAIEKFEGSIQRNLNSSMQTALNNGYIEQNKYEELVQFFRGLNEDFRVTKRNDYDLKQKLSKQQNKENQENISTFTQQSTVKIEECKSDEENEGNEEDLIRNAKEATEFFDKNKFTLSTAEPRFTKRIEEEMSAFYLGKILPNELKHLHKTAQQISDLLCYEWRIGVQFGEDAHIYIQFMSEKQNQFEVWAQLKQKLNIDKEGDDNNTYGSDHIGKECANQYFDLMKKIFAAQKLDLLKLHKNEKEYIDNKRLLKQLKNCIPVLFFPPKTREGPYVRPSQFKNNWLECCVKYNYPGRDILNKIKLNGGGTTKDNENDIKTSQNEVDELTNLTAQYTIED